MIKKLIYILIIFAPLVLGCSKKNVEAEPQVNLVKNESILVKTLLYTDWASPATIMSMPYAEIRNSFITSMKAKCGNSLSELQEISDYNLCWSAMMYKFLLDAGEYTAPKLLTMSLDDYRNSVINLNLTNSKLSASQLQASNNAKNLNIAYGWWFNQNVQTKQMIDKFSDIAGSNPHFDMKDNRNAGMDVLRIVKADEAYIYLGVYHSMVSDGRFKLYLAGSNDLKIWTNIVELGDRAHQGDIKKWENGYLLANEQDVVQGSNNIQIRYYASYADLIVNNPTNSKSISRNFSSLAEGTPDIRKIEGNSPTSSHIVIGYHYYDNGIRDQQAIGILQDFSDWKTWKDEVSNYNIQEMGYQGNIGGRSAFSRNGNWVLQEAQITSGDWSSWRILFGNGAFYYTINFSTPFGSTSFANPGIAPIESNKFAVTSFMPSQGNQNGEIGELLYTVQF